MIAHHLDGSTLLSYSAGTLGEALSVVVAAHVDMCPDCRRSMNLCDAVGGAMLDDIDVASLSHECRDAIMDQILHDETAQPAEQNVQVSRPIGGAEALPAPLRELLGKPLDQLKWKRLAPGVKYVPLPLAVNEPGDLRLLDIQPGRRMPEHGHGGTELTLVLKGSYSDEFGDYGPGDIADMDEDVDHQPVVGKEGCVCIVASEHPAKFHGVVGRLLQPWTGM